MFASVFMATRAGRRWYPPAILVLLTLFFAACSSSGVTGSAPGTRGNSGIGRLSQRSKVTATAVPCTPVSNAVEQVMASVVRIETPPDASGRASAGTGFVVASDVVLTNQHVVSGVNTVHATFIDQHRAVGRVVAMNEAQDLALILVDTGIIPPVVWGDDSSLVKGSRLWAIGYAFDHVGLPDVNPGSYQQTYVDRQSGQAYLLSDLGLNHGDSGGPLLNQCGQVVGVSTARIRGEERAGLAIPEYFAHRWTAEQIQQHK